MNNSNGYVPMWPAIEKRPQSRPPPPPYPGPTFKDLSNQLSECLAKMKQLQEENAKMKQDNQELRDLCCFLDDDRQRARKLAKEWQKFGRYTAKVMRQEVANYQHKLKQLDGRQQELVKDNYELKDLCLYLDEERNCLDLSCPHCGLKILSRPNSVVPTEFDEDESAARHKALDSEGPSSSNSSGVMSMSSQDSCEDRHSKEVLEIYQSVMMENEEEKTNETQKAIIQAMCNVVWRVLEKKK